MRIVLDSGPGTAPVADFRAKVDVMHSARKQVISFDGRLYVCRQAHHDGFLIFSPAKRHDLTPELMASGTYKLC